MSGEFGEQLVREYLDKMRSMPSVRIGSESLARDFFVLCLAQIGESWRRFCHNHQSFPHVLCKLCALESTADLCKELARFQQEARQCPECVDPEFTAVLLGKLPSPFDPANPDHVHIALKIQQFLQDLSVFTPVSTDSVEALHGFAQSSLHRFRGTKPTDNTAKEICLWGKLLSSWDVVMKWIWDRTGDTQARRRVSAFYNRSSSSVRVGHRPKLTMLQVRAMSKVEDNAEPSRNPRFKRKRLCGFLAAID